MQRISSKSRSPSSSVPVWENVDSQQDAEEFYFPSFDLDSKDLLFDYKSPGLIISLANKSTDLSKYFDLFKVEFTDTYSPSGWSMKTSCIFPDHDDSSPSFFYNRGENIFNCFGCQRGGGPVQLLSYMYNKDPFEVAKELISCQEINNQIEIERQDNLFSCKDILFDFADSYYKFKSSNQDKQELADNISLCFDFYVRNSMKNNTFNKLQLKAIFNWCNSKFEEESHK